ncbi:ParA family protein [Crossiella cryophila]|uniref:Cellulose biosynthesis protein BcsQ n=1 Tax=Crossiella cryophila TaxID=43355 RepID=A0A7W7FTI2_9PSEU|nr:ParA family protein [Crossiella cryophila]MBB4677227.1 cellulose biosynthesis protein BcsQ [Crossiella cryophila]
MDTPKIILVTKPKGGVGATHVCALLAHGLAATEPTLFADLEPQGDGAQILAVPMRATGTVKDFLFDTRPHAEVLREIPTAARGYYLAPDPELNRPTGAPLYDPGRLRRAAAEAGITWVVVDTVKLPDTRTLAVLAEADLVLCVVANAFGIRTLAHTQAQLARRARPDALHTLVNRIRKDRSEMMLLDSLIEHDDAERFRICPVHIGHDGWVAHAVRHSRSPFAVGNAQATHRASAALADWVQGRLA